MTVTVDAVSVTVLSMNPFPSPSLFFLPTRPHLPLFHHKSTTSTLLIPSSLSTFVLSFPSFVLGSLDDCEHSIPLLSMHKQRGNVREWRREGV